MIAMAIARFFRLLSAKRITTATSSPPVDESRTCHGTCRGSARSPRAAAPKANMHTTAHVTGQKPCSQPCDCTFPQSRCHTAKSCSGIEKMHSCTLRTQSDVLSPAARSSRTIKPRRAGGAQATSGDGGGGGGEGGAEGGGGLGGGGL